LEVLLRLRQVRVGKIHKGIGKRGTGHSGGRRECMDKKSTHTEKDGAKKASFLPGGKGERV